ncbi:nicotinamide riboside transporter PnuC [Jeotgalibaca caeni]|uniref:nicotinamide riboside transporter PnuC n=1 Tax=Jeotgalibaca caeni TaxID=3028623 RepID=UPI00237E4B7C|nr:nicotinamide riboside transporter PnuC [Jeotgalibaca caeni]MDE1549821.1 nicotinamide riboside transporter PnuC [Jeotgalibaca caeni]
MEHSLEKKKVQIKWFNIAVSIVMIILTFNGSMNNGWMTLANLVSWLGLIGTIGLAHAKTWNFPPNMAQNLFGTVQAWQSALYGDMFMSAFYFLSNLFIGLPSWLKNKSDDDSDGDIKIVKTTDWKTIIIAVIGGGILLGVVSYFMGGNYIVLDSINNSTAIVAQVMQMRRNRNSWWLWGLTNVIGVVIWLGVGQPQMAVMYVCFALNSVRGWINWGQGQTDAE